MIKWPIRFRFLRREADGAASGWLLTVQIVDTTGVEQKTVIVNVGKAATIQEIFTAARQQVDQAAVIVAGSGEAVLDDLIAQGTLFDG